MLYYKNLEEIIFHRHTVVRADELVIVSGYVGPNPVSRLPSIPLKSTVVYGMYGVEGVRGPLHQSLLSLHSPYRNLNILYSKTPIHSKCYVWKFNNSIVHALVGSANFSTNGLSTPYREILAETSVDTFAPLETYINSVISNSIACDSGVATVGQSPRPVPTRTTDYCRMTLLDPDTNDIPATSGLNWGQNPNNHTNPDDAYIPVRADYIRLYPELFPPKQAASLVTDAGRSAHRHNDSIEIIWDDGTNMEGLLEGSRTMNGVLYPKQISSFPEKNILGKYMRRRLSLPEGARVTKADLERYGRAHVDVSLQSEGVYYFNFSQRYSAVGAPTSNL